MTFSVRTLFLGATFLSALLLPWLVTAAAALALALWIPLAPLAVGLFVDALYYSAHAAWLPWGTVLGLVASLAAYFVRSQLAAGIIE